MFKYFTPGSGVTALGTTIHKNEQASFLVLF
jgi:hypothetical protein